MFCPECGYKNDDENKFCLRCGKEITQKTVTNLNNTAATNQNASPNIHNSENNNYNLNYAYPNRPVDMCVYTKRARTIRLVVGIISIILSLVVVFQSCAAGIVNSFASPEAADGTAGFFLSVFMLTSGIISIAARKTKGGIITAASFYLFGAVIGLANVGIFGDLMIWSVVAIIFAVLLIISLTMKDENKDPEKFSIDFIIMAIAAAIAIIISVVIFNEKDNSNAVQNAASLFEEDEISYSFKYEKS